MSQQTGVGGVKPIEIGKHWQGEQEEEEPRHGEREA